MGRKRKDNSSVDPRTPRFCQQYCGFLGVGVNYGTGSDQYVRHLATWVHRRNFAAHWATFVGTPPPAPQHQDENNDHEDHEDHEDHGNYDNHEDHDDYEAHENHEDQNDKSGRQSALLAAENIAREQDREKIVKINAIRQELLEHIESMRDQTPTIVVPGTDEQTTDETISLSSEQTTPGIPESLETPQEKCKLANPSFVQTPGSHACLSVTVNRADNPEFFPANSRTEALMLTWVALVAPFVPDWALLSLDSIIRDPGFNPKEMRGLLALRDLKSGPLKNVPKVESSTRQTPSGPLRVADITTIVRQVFGIPQVGGSPPLEC